MTKDSRLVVLVDREFSNRIRQASKQEKRPVADMVREAVGQYLTQKEAAAKMDRLIEWFKTAPRIRLGKYRDPRKLNRMLSERHWDRYVRWAR